MPNTLSFYSILFACLLVTACAPGLDVEVQTDSGNLIGKRLDGVERYFGVPFAEPPTGNRRWQTPQPLQVTTDTRIAYFESPACIQTGGLAYLPAQSEDCLYLNIWKPEGEGPFPVMFWIHGGALTTGSSTEPQYDPSTLVIDQQVVVVSTNYRLGQYGFVALSSASEQIIGNQGFYDQLAALQWVNRNISAFAGDSNNVTIFGESAGAISSCYLLASPLTDGLIHKAILQSGACTTIPPLSIMQAQQRGDEFLRDIGCADQTDPLACARALDVDTINNAVEGSPLALFQGDLDNLGFTAIATIGDALIPSPTEELLTNSDKANNVSLLIGTNRDEGSLFTSLINFQNIADTSDYLDFLAEFFPGTDVSGLAAQYPAENFSSIGSAVSQIFTDLSFVCPARQLADIWADSNRSTFVYQFTQEVTASIELLDLFLGSASPELGTFHASEIPYIFGIDSILGVVTSDEQNTTRAAMMQYWANFAHTGNPNTENLADWPSYSSTQREHLILNQDFLPGAQLRQMFCDYFADNPFDNPITQVANN